MIFLICCLFIHPVQAANSYSSVYITISDIMMSTKQDKETEAQQAIADLQAQWAMVTSTETAAKEKVDAAINGVVQAASKEERLSALTSLSHALVALEKLENPVDEEGERANFAEKFRPVMKDFEAALATANIETIDLAYKSMNSRWNKYERPIREQNIAMYGQIETQLAFIRISLAAEEVDLALIESQYNEFKTSIESFIAGEETSTVVGDYSLSTLITLIDEAQAAIDAGEFQVASDALREFIVVWPSVEMEISTHNGSLYKKLESDIPILVSSLLKSDVDTATINDKLTKYRTEIELIQGQTGYSFWDSALILLREGLEALLIILALVSALNKSGYAHLRKWIFVGAIAGMAVSALVAILMSTLWNTATIDTNREVMEGYVGLAAAALMIGVGIWLHNKSSVASWNRYISKQMNNAISSGSIFAMASVSFLSVFREGAETLVFYAGIAPKMETSQFVFGIAVALAILVVIGVVLFKLSGKLPIHKLFAVATVMIYVLAFKIIGVSIHTLQLTNKLSTTIVDGLPVINSIGFYPTVETIIGQAVLVVVVIITIVYKRLQQR
ncbi:FTR1 family protein [Solibacillus sp. CAU 1738]